MHWTVWLRLPGDMLFAFGALQLMVCVGRALVGLFQQPTLHSLQGAAAPLQRPS